MDMKEASAMTEASGLMSEQGSDGRSIESASQDFAIRCAERLRKVTIEAPLQSLFVSVAPVSSVTIRRQLQRRLPEECAPAKEID